MSERHNFLYVSKFLRQAKGARPFPGMLFFLAHHWALRVVILELSSLSPCWSQPHLFTSLPSPTSNSISPVSLSQPPTMTEQYFNRCITAGHQNRFFLRKKWEFQNHVLFSLQHLLKWRNNISSCTPPNFFFLHPYHNSNRKLVSSSESNREASNRIGSYSSIFLRLHVLQRNESPVLHHQDELPEAQQSPLRLCKHQWKWEIKCEPFLTSYWILRSYWSSSLSSSLSQLAGQMVSKTQAKGQVKCRGRSCCPDWKGSYFLWWRGSVFASSQNSSMWCILLSISDFQRPSAMHSIQCCQLSWFDHIISEFFSEEKWYTLVLLPFLLQIAQALEHCRCIYKLKVSQGH